MADAENADPSPAQAEAAEIECGIIMPIAEMPGYPAAHWEAMLELISRGIKKAGMQPTPVWENGPADVLQERIVRNLYEQPYAVCDVSGLNPNVMLELGIRLAFGKPTIIVNDGVARAPFDIGPAEYVPYDRSLHFQRAEEFADRLSARIGAVKSVVDAGTYRAYIKTFGPIDLGSPGNESVPITKVVLDQVAQLTAEIRSMKGGQREPAVDALADIGWPIAQASEDHAMAFPVMAGAIDEAASAIRSRLPDVSVIHSTGRNRILVITPDLTPAMRHRMRFEIQALIEKAEMRAVIG